MVHLETFNLQVKTLDQNIVELIEKFPGRWVSIDRNKYTVLEDSPMPAEELCFGTKPLLTYIPYGLLDVRSNENATKKGKTLHLSDINPVNRIIPIGHFMQEYPSYIENIINATASKEVCLNLPDIMGLKKVAEFPVYFNKEVEQKIDPFQVLSAQNQIPPWINGETFAISNYGITRDQEREFKANSKNKFKFFEYAMIVYDKNISPQKRLKI